MLYTLFLYQNESGQLLYDKSFQELSQEKLELFAGFFQALKTFISEIIITGEESLRNLDLGEYTVLITTVSEINADLVIIADKADVKHVNKIIPKMMKVLLKNKQAFLEGGGNRDNFNVLDNPITEIVQSQSHLLGEKTLIERPITILKSIWERIKDIPPEQKKDLIDEKAKLIQELDEDSTNVRRKLIINKRLLEISEKLKDEEGYLDYQDGVRKLSENVCDIRLKMNYYLERIKETMHEAVKKLGDKNIKDGIYRDVYLNLYSFSNKLKLLTSGDNWLEFQNIAKMLIEKEQVSDSELADSISKILKMRDNIDDFIN